MVTRSAGNRNASNKSAVKIPWSGHKRFVIEPCRKQGRQDIVDSTEIKISTWPTIHALGFKAFGQLYLGRPKIRLITIADELDQSVWFFGAAGQDAAGPVILETAGNNPNIVSD